MRKGALCAPLRTQAPATVSGVELGTALGASWSAGISVYAVIAALGLAGRLGWIHTAELLQRPWVIGVAVALAVVDLLVDKVALLDSAWDLVHTIIRPAAGAAIGALAPAQQIGTDLPSPVVMALTCGLLALSSHTAKASIRAVVNTSPEPASNVVVSFLEDGLVAGVLALAIAFPRVAAVVTAVLFVISTVIAVVLFRVARRAVRRIRARRRARAVPDRGPAPLP